MDFSNIQIEQIDSYDSSWKELKNFKELKDYFDDWFFDKLKSGEVKIKKENNLYIFEEPDASSQTLDENWNLVNRFCVKESLFDDYLEKKEEYEKNMTDYEERLSLFFSELTTKKQLWDLQWDIQQIWWYDEILSEKDKLIRDIDELLEFFEENLDEKPKWPDDKRWKFWQVNKEKKNFKKVIRDNIRWLDNIKDDLEDYNTYNQENLDTYINYINKLKSHKKRIETARQDITLWNTDVDMPSILNSEYDIEREDRYQEAKSERNIKLNELMKNATLKKLWNEDMEWFREYLMWVWSWQIEHPSQDKFYTEHRADFEVINAIDPALYGRITTKDKYANSSQSYSGGWNKNYSNYSTSKKSWWMLEQWWRGFSDLLVKAWIIDENDTKKKEARAKFGKVWILAIWAVFLYKIFTDKWNRLKWLGGLVWWAIALNNVDNIKKRFGDAFGSENADAENICKNTNTPKPLAEEYIIPQANTLRCIGGIPIKTLIDQNILVEEWGKIKIDYVKYENYINSTWDDDEKKMQLDALDKIKKNDPENMVHNSLASFWINSLDELGELSQDDETTTLLDIDNTKTYFENLSNPINAEFRKKWYKPKDIESRYTIMQEHDWDELTDQEIKDREEEWLLVKISDT